MFNLMRRFLIFLPLFFVVGVLCAEPTAAWAEDKVVAIVSVQTPPTLAADREAIEANVAKGLRAARWTVLDLADTTRLVGADKSLLNCTGDLCAVQIVRATKAHYLVWVEVTERKRQYAVSLKLFEGTKGALPMASEYGELSAKALVLQVASLATAVGREAAEIVEELAHPDGVPGENAPVVAVVSVKVPSGLQHSQDKMESGVGRGLELAGWVVTSVFESTRAVAERKDLRDCTSESCMAEISRLVGASYLVRAGVKIGKGKYTVSLSLFDATNATKPLASEDEEASNLDPDCPPVEKKISYAARELGRKAIKLVPKSAALAMAPATSGTPLGVPPAAYPPPLPPADRSVLLAEEPKSHTGLRIAGWTAVGAGAALLVDSIYYFHEDRQGTDCHTTSIGDQCLKLYHNESRAYLIGGVGLASALVGGYILLFPAREHPTTVALTSRGILLGGRF
jgi:hypothetical protein